MNRGVNKLDPSSQVACDLRREALVDGGATVTREVVQYHPDLVGLWVVLRNEEKSNKPTFEDWLKSRGSGEDGETGGSS